VSDFSFVGVAGFEPATFCSQSRRANRAALYPVLTTEALAKVVLSTEALAKVVLSTEALAKVVLSTEALAKVVLSTKL
jgi:hypothetical protein